MAPHPQRGGDRKPPGSETAPGDAAVFPLLGMLNRMIFWELVRVFLLSLVGLTGLFLVGGLVQQASQMGLSPAQVLWRVELPLALPVILTGIRIVLVQNIGLATIAALIGGGGFGVFVFQGIGQTAMDLVLLGAIPTVGLAFAAAIVMDGIVEMVRGRGQAAA